MEEPEFFTQEQAVALITLLLEKGNISFPCLSDEYYWTNDKRVETLSAVGETLLALLRQLTGKPGVKPSEAEGLIRELERIRRVEQKTADQKEPIPF